MNYPRKLKQDSSITGLLPAIAAIAVLIVANIFWGKTMAYKALAAILLIMVNIPAHHAQNQMEGPRSP